VKSVIIKKGNRGQGSGGKVIKTILDTGCVMLDRIKFTITLKY
jgi:hypothetical protein